MRATRTSPTGRARSTRLRRCSRRSSSPAAGPALTDRKQIAEGLASTRAFISELYARCRERRARRQGSARDLPRCACRVAAEIRPLGDLRSLPAVRRDARVRRSDRAPRSAHLDRRARPGDVAGARRLSVVDRDVRDDTLALPYAAPAECHSTEARAPAGDRRRWRAGGAHAGDRSRALRHAGAAARRRRQAVDRLARHLLREALARNLGPAGLRRSDRQQGRVVEGRQGVLRRPARLCIRPACRKRDIAARRSSTCSSITSKACSTTTRSRSRISSCDGSTRSSASSRRTNASPSPSIHPTAPTDCAAITSLPVTDRARRSARCWGSKPAGRSSATAS